MSVATACPVCHDNHDWRRHPTCYPRYLEAQNASLRNMADGYRERAERLKANLAAAQFSEREWRDKAQDKIAECDALEAEVESLREERERHD